MQTYVTSRNCHVEGEDVSLKQGQSWDSADQKVLSACVNVPVESAKLLQVCEGY